MPRSCCTWPKRRWRAPRRPSGPMRPSPRRSSPDPALVAGEVLHPAVDAIPRRARRRPHLVPAHVVALQPEVVLLQDGIELVEGRVAVAHASLVAHAVRGRPGLEAAVVGVVGLAPVLLAPEGLFGRGIDLPVVLPGVFHGVSPALLA